MSNPPVQDGSPGYRVRPSSDEIEALITAHRGFPKEERQAHFHMKPIADDAEMNAVLSALAGELSGSARAKSADAVLGHLCDGEKRICSPGSARHKRACRVSSSAMSTETKRRKRKLRRSSDLELEADFTAPDLGDDAANVDLEDDVESCGGARVSRYVSEEEDVPSLVRRNHRSKVNNNVPVQALLGMVSLQGMTMSAIDHALEDIIPEDLLLELSEAGGADIRMEVPDCAPSASFLAGQEMTPLVCHAPPTFKGTLIRENTLVLEGIA